MDTNSNQKPNSSPDQAKNAGQKGAVPPNANANPSPGTLIWMNILIFWIVITVLTFFNASQLQSIPYSQFLSDLDRGSITEVTISQHEVTGKYKGSPERKFITQRVDPDLATKLAEKHVTFSAISEDNFFKTLAGWVVPAVIFAMVWFFMIGRLGARDGMNPLMNIERNKARVYIETDTKVTFADVAGVDEAKEELQEVINFLKQPEQYSKLGAHLPKGILLVGPPGTGKTLLARAVAGEAGVPFFSISGSEFVELYVGVGAARVRDLFAQAQQKAPCIIFIDELDALGRARGLNPVSGAHDEKEQTLNQLLVELDGFDPRQGVVLLAATNRPEIIDTALLRAGRFDRHIVVDRPDKLGRVQILRVHLKGVTFNGDVDLEEMAAQTPGFTGADLANLVNEAVLLAARRKASTVCREDFAQALERIIAGPEKKNRLLNVKERTIVAYHEIGHALVALSLPGSDPVQKVSIIPRGIGALGYTIQRPTEDRFLMSKTELENKMTVLLGGRAAETIVFGDASTGAADDFAKATDIARSMVTKYGMLDKLGLVAYETEPSSFLQIPGGEGFERRNFSEETAREIDCAVRNLIDTAFKRAVDILKKNRSYLEAAAQELLRKETLSHDELMALVPPATISIVSDAAKELVPEPNGDRGDGRKISKMAV